MTTKTVMTYTVFGVSYFKGQHRLRFSNDMAKRMSTLVAMGDEEINLVELPSAMNKLQAVQWAQASGQFETESEKAVIAAFVEKNNKVDAGEPKKRGRPRKTAEVAVPTLAAVTDEVGSDEAGSDEAGSDELDAAAEAAEMLDSIDGNEELSDDELLAQLAAEDDEQLEADVA